MNNGHDEIVLKGGRANTGNVVRIGDQVARPSYPQTPAVDHFLRYLECAGVTFAPRPIGFDNLGRQRVSFIEGTAPAPPYPSWAFNEALMLDVATRQQELHRLARGYEPPVHAPWAESAGDYFPPDALRGEALLVCHNDLGMTNVIVDDSHQLVGFIDFDYCRPVDPLFDIAVAARHWAPFGDLDIAGDPDIDRVRRFGLFCDVHDLSPPQRQRVVNLAVSFLEHARRNIKALATAGGVGFQTLLANGYEATNIATVSWLAEHAESLVATS